MKTKRLLQWLPTVAAVLLATACSSDNDLTSDNGGKQVKVIHYEATVSDGNATRATLNGSKEYIFEVGDQLYVEGTDIKGVLTLKSGDEGMSTGVTFTGDLEYTGDGTPADGLTLTAILVRASNDKVHTVSGGKVTATAYPTTAIASTLTEAVEQYSHFTAESTFGQKSFTLYQQSAFLSFTVTFEDGTAANTDVNISISNGGSEVRTGSVTTATVESKVVAQFVAAFPGGETTMDNASVTLDSRDAILFGGTTTLAVNKVYNIKKTVEAAADALEAIDLGIVVDGKKILWANKNIGALKITNYGDYFYWAGTTGYAADDTSQDFKWANTPYYTGDGSTHSWSKYTGSDGLNTLETMDDAAHVVLGGDWYIPTMAEFQALVTNTTKAWKQDYNGSGINGYEFTGNNGNSIFLPAAGQRVGTSLSGAGNLGVYWATLLFESIANGSCYLYFNSSGTRLDNYSYRCYGSPVRAVQRVSQ